MKHITDQDIIQALRASNGYSYYAARRLDCPEGIIKDRIRTSPQVAKVLWAIVRARQKAKGFAPAGKSKSGNRRARRPYYKTSMTYRERLRNRGHFRSNTPAPQIGLFDHLEWLNEPD